MDASNHTSSTSCSDDSSLTQGGSGEDDRDNAPAEPTPNKSLTYSPSSLADREGFQGMERERTPTKPESDDEDLDGLIAQVDDSLRDSVQGRLPRATASGNFPGASPLADRAAASRDADRVAAEWRSYTEAPMFSPPPPPPRRSPIAKAIDWLFFSPAKERARRGDAGDAEPRDDGAAALASEYASLAASGAAPSPKKSRAPSFAAIVSCELGPEAATHSYDARCLQLTAMRVQHSTECSDARCLQRWLAAMQLAAKASQQSNSVAKLLY